MPRDPWLTLHKPGKKGRKRKSSGESLCLESGGWGKRDSGKRVLLGNAPPKRAKQGDESTRRHCITRHLRSTSDRGVVEYSLSLSRIRRRACQGGGHEPRPSGQRLQRLQLHLGLSESNKSGNVAQGNSGDHEKDIPASAKMTSSPPGCSSKNLVTS